MILPTPKRVRSDAREWRRRCKRQERAINKCATLLELLTANPYALSHFPRDVRIKCAAALKHVKRQDLKCL